MNDLQKPRRYHRGRWHVLENAVMSALTRAGLIPHSYLLTTVGRTTGLPRTNPVTIVIRNNQRWLVAPYGPVAWVHNARAAGEVALARRGTSQRFALRPATPDEAGPVLKRYVAIASVTRDYFYADVDAPATEFTAEAVHHPVFELLPIGRAERTRG